jgi:hypothetical protein
MILLSLTDATTQQTKPFCVDAPALGIVDDGPEFREFSIDSDGNVKNALEV